MWTESEYIAKDKEKVAISLFSDLELLKDVPVGKR